MPANADARFVEFLLSQYGGVDGLAQRFGATAAARRDALSTGEGDAKGAAEALEHILGGSTRGGFRPTNTSHHGLLRLRAIIDALDFPTYEVVGDTLAPIDPAAPWARLNQDASWLGPFIRATGRIELGDGKTFGTGFLVAPDLLMTARHVAIGLVTRGFLPLGPNATDTGQLFFRREARAAYDEAPVRVLGLVLVHPYWDVAIVRIEPVAERTTMVLAASPPEALSRRSIAVIGHPHFDLARAANAAEIVEAFGDEPGWKRVQPGRLDATPAYWRPPPQDDKSPHWQPLEGWPTVTRALAHAASTLPGNSGSLVVDLEAQCIIGVHFAGHAHVANYSVPTWELSRDPNIRALVDVKFDGDGPSEASPDVEAAWNNWPTHGARP